MRTSFTKNENVPGSFFYPGTFFAIHSFNGLIIFNDHLPGADILAITAGVFGLHGLDVKTFKNLSHARRIIEAQKKTTFDVRELGRELTEIIS